jgi:hypothetical protein
MTTVPITLQLSDTLVEQAQRVGTVTRQGLEAVLSEALGGDTFQTSTGVP